MITARPRYAFIARLAERLLEDARVSRPPVPVEALARTQGCKIAASDLKDISGILVRSSDTVVIGVNRKHPETRRRFTIAHELGHFLLHEGREVRFDREFRVSLRSEASSAGANVEEIEANFFAASILMPDRLLTRDPRASSIELEDAAALKDLAKGYGVSIQAMTLRLARLIGRKATPTIALPSQEASASSHRV